MITNTWVVYLAGESHTDWRNQIISGANDAKSPITFTGTMTDRRDLCSVNILR